MVYSITVFLSVFRDAYNSDDSAVSNFSFLFVLSWTLDLFPNKIQSRFTEVKNAEWRLGFELRCIQ